MLEGNKQITIKLSDWKQLVYNAAVQDKEPVMSIRIGGLNLMLHAEGDCSATSGQ